MSKVSFADQFLPIDYLLGAQTDIKAGKSVSGNDLLLAIEQAIQQSLPDEVRSIVRQASIPNLKTRGRPRKFGASLDLALDRVDHFYPALLRYEQRKRDIFLRSGKARSKGDSPSMLAYTRLLRHMKNEFGPMTWEALRNMHSRWRMGRFHSAKNNVDSDDFDDEVDGRFPAATST
jgi:hypothetical protein